MEFVDIGAASMRLRMIKSPEEIAHITKMTRIADIGGAACVEAIAVGPFNYLGCISCRTALYSLPVLAEERKDALENQY